MSDVLCINCNKYNGSYKYNDNKYCSNCYYYVKEGKWKIMPISLIKKSGYDKFINKNKINYIFKIISGYYENMELNNLHDLLKDTKITSQHCETLYNIFSKENDSNYNIELEHIICSKVINYWELKSSIGVCYYGNWNEEPSHINALYLKLKQNENTFTMMTKFKDVKN